MPDSSREKGRRGERVAVEYLIRQGYRVYCTNFQVRQGEIDIIAYTGDELHFIEVKCWSTLDIENIQWSVNSTKINKIRVASQIFLQRHPLFDDHYISYDLIFLSGTSGKPEHLINVF